MSFILQPSGGGGALIPTTAPGNGQLPIGNGTDYAVANLTAGTNITITNGPGSILIDAAGGASGSDIFLANNFGGA